MNIYSTPRVIAHRGCGSLGTENSLAGITYAISRGVRGIEIDVQLTLDGIPVVHHDSKLRDGRRIASINSGDLPGNALLLTTVLRYCHATESWVNVEVKFDREDRETEMAAHVRAMAAGRLVASIVAQHTARSCCPNMVSSFSNSVLAGAAQCAEAGRILLAGIMFKPVGELPPNIVIPDHMAHTAGFEEYCRNHNVWVWGSEVSKTDADGLFRAGVIGIITDRPDVL